MPSPIAPQAGLPYIVATYVSEDDAWEDFQYWSHYPTLQAGKRCLKTNADGPHHQYLLRASDLKVLAYQPPRRKTVRVRR